MTKPPAHEPAGDRPADDQPGHDRLARQARDRLADNRTAGHTVDLYLLRHAHAGNPERWSGPDEDRPLSARGRRQAERLGAFLADRGLRPDAILTSPKARALETANLVAHALGGEPRVDDRLAGPLDLADLDAVLADAGDPARPLVVGHDPDFSELAAALCDTAGLHLAKGALARIEAPRPLRPGEGLLRWLVPPDLLDPRG